jgi:hypothetical protein
LDRSSEQVTVLRHWLSNADPDPKVDWWFSLLIAALQRSLNVNAGFNGTRNGCERGHDAIAGVLHFAPTPFDQCGTHNFVVFVEEHHVPFVAKLLRVLRGVTQVCEQNGPHCGFDVSISRLVLGRRSKERVYWPFTHLNYVVGYEAMGFSMDSFHGFPAGALGEAKGCSFVVIKPIRYVTNSVIVLNRKIEFVGLGDLGRCHARHIVAIEE